MIHYNPNCPTSLEWAIFYFVLACSSPHIPNQLAQEQYMWNRLLIAALGGEI